MMSQHEEDFIAQSRRINDYCLGYGCFFETAWMRGFETSRIDAYISDPARSAEPRELVYKTINDWFTAMEYHPFERAHFIYRAQQTPKIREVSHYLDRGLIHYYKGDFFSAASVLIPAVEGLVRLYLNGANLIGTKLIDAIQKINVVIPHSHYHDRHAMYVAFLVRWLKDWFFSHTTSPQLGTIPSNLNRNNVLHLFDSRPFYRPADCNRILSFFDIALEVLTIEEPVCEKFLSYPAANIPEVNSRQEYFTGLMLPWSPWRAIRNSEETRFMAANPAYESSDVPDWAGLNAALQEEMEAELKAMLAGHEPSMDPLPPNPITKDSPPPS